MSVLVSPLLLVAEVLTLLLLPRFANCDAPRMEELSEQQHAPVVVAGYGRYGRDCRPPAVLARRYRDGAGP
jgi:glutathione-regulated potassium-efflux system ancillary protein KefC